MEGSPHIQINADRLVIPPQNSTCKEGCEEGYAIIQLHTRPSHVEFIEKPVDIQERGRDLVEDEVETIIVCKRTLYDKSAKRS